MIYDGKKEAEKVRQELINSGKLNGKSLLILQADGQRRESTYVRLKREMGESFGVKVSVEFVESKSQLVNRLGDKVDEDGVLVQLPIIGSTKDEIQEILDMIPVNKDVDGLTTFSKFLPAAIRAVDKVLVHAWVVKNLHFLNAAVVGANGMMGRKLVKRLEERALDVAGFDIGDNLERLVNYDVVVAATGSPSIIKAEMLKDGAVVIDLGYPQGDVDFESARSKSKLITPVPGGVGPLTVVSLFENLAQA